MLLAEDGQHVRDLVTRAERLDVTRANIAEQAVEHGQRPVEIEALDIQHPTLVGVHQHRDAHRLRALPYEDLGEEIVALFHQQIERLGTRTGPDQKRIDVGLVDSIREHFDVQIGINLRHLSRSDEDLRQAQRRDGSAQSVHVGQRETVEVGEPERTRDTFLRHGHRAGLAHRQADDADALACEHGLLVGRDLVVIASTAELEEFLLREQMHESTRPRVEHPCPVFVDRATSKMVTRHRGQLSGTRLGGRRANRHELQELHVQRVMNRREASAVDQRRYDLAIGSAIEVEQPRAPFAHFRSTRSVRAQLGSQLLARHGHDRILSGDTLRGAARPPVRAACST